MKVRKTILLLSFLGALNCCAQDSILFSQRIAENISPFTSKKEEIYKSPALRPYYRLTNYSSLAVNLERTDKDLYLRQEGSGNDGLKINSESFLKDLKGTTLWGKANYINNKVKNVNYNETLDYQYVYPYVMADTVGGNLTAETYYFGGGLSKKIGALRYGIDGGFKGIQSFRDVDPRPKNISADIHISASAAKEFSNGKAFSLDLNLQKYKQNNSLDFVNELGFPLVYHDTGLGVYNELLAGTRMQAYYKGLRLGAQLNFLPTNLEGIALQVGYSRFNLGKELSSIADKVSAIEEDQAHILVAFNRKINRHNYLFKLRGSYTKRNGTEAVFANIGQASLYKVDEGVRYENVQLNLDLNAVYHTTIKDMNFYLGLETSFNEVKENYISPDRFLNYQRVNYSGFISIVKPIRTTLVNLAIKAGAVQRLNSSFSWIGLNRERGMFEMLNANYAYLSSSSKVVSTTLRVDFPLTNKLSAFTKANAMYTHYDTDRKATTVSLSAGVTF